MAQAGLGEDLLLANEADRPGPPRVCSRALDARVTLAIDSPETLEAAAKAGIREVLIDVNVGLPRCGCAPEAAGALADSARQRGLAVRGVMGYEGHVVGIARGGRAPSRLQRRAWPCLPPRIATSAASWSRPAGPAPTRATTSPREIQAGILRADGHRLREARPALRAGLLGARQRDLGLGRAMHGARWRSEGPRHGSRQSGHPRCPRCGSAPTSTSPSRPSSKLAVGDRVRVHPAHVDPTIAYHQAFQIVSRRGRPHAARPSSIAGRSICAAGSARWKPPSQSPSPGSSIFGAHRDCGRYRMRVWPIRPQSSELRLLGERAGRRLLVRRLRGAAP